MISRNTLLLAALQGPLTFALFSPALHDQYMMVDDVQYTSECPQTTAGLSLANIQWAFTTVHESWYSPLLWISYMADSTLFGPRPAGYHFTNILLHALNAMLLFWILVRLVRSPLAAFIAAALWALHPLRVESVAWVAERKDVLSGFFFLLAIWAYVRYVEAPSPARRRRVFFCMLAGMLSKTMLVVLPPLLLLLDLWPLRRLPAPASRDDLRRWRPLLREKNALFVLMLAGIALTLYTHHHAHDNAPTLSAAARLALIAPAYWGHLRQILWPAHLSFFYPVAYPSPRVCLLALAAILLLLGLAWRQRNSWPYLLVGLLWFLIALAPVIRGIRFDEQSAWPDRYTYLAAMGLSLLLAGGLAAFAGTSRRRRVGAGGLAAILLAALATRTLAYLPQWESAAVMAPILIRQVPGNALVNNMYGQLLAMRHQPDEAIPYFQKAVHWNIVASCNLASALLHAGRPAEALPVAIEICANPKAPPEAFLSLGVAYLQLDQATNAIPPLQRATQLMPAYPLAWQLLYRANLEAKKLTEARACILQLQTLNSLDVLNFDGLIRLYVRTWMQDNARLAWPFFANNFKRNPENVLLFNDAAWLLAVTENPPAPPAEAVRLAQTAVSLGGAGHPELLDTLAAAQAANGEFEAAIQTAQHALDLLSSLPPETQSLRPDLQQRLEHYQRHECWREPVENPRGAS